MNTRKITDIQGIKMPELTPGKIQELKRTPKGRHITSMYLDAFPDLLKMMESGLHEQLARYEHIKSAGRDAATSKMLLLEMLENHLYWEFAYHIMFVKWREQRLSKAS